MKKIFTIILAFMALALPIAAEKSDNGSTQYTQINAETKASSDISRDGGREATGRSHPLRGLTA